VSSLNPALAVAAGRPHLATLGFHRLTLLLVGLNATVALVTFPFYESFGLAIDWSSFTVPLVATAFAIAGWLGPVATPGRAAELPIAESLLVFVLMAACCTVVTPAQYLAVALDRPLADGWLARADAFMGISVPEAVSWTRSHPWLVRVLWLSYFSLQAQFVAPILLLGILRRDRDRLWEFAFHFHVCLIATLLGLVLFPAMCAFGYYRFEALIDQTVFIRDFAALRSGTFTVLRLTELEGLITFPTFHVAGGLIVTWVFRRYAAVFAGLLLLNTLMIASTVLLGPHYAIDIVASVALVGLSILLYRHWGRRLLGASEP